ncbi:DUF4920 domain-containing protein [Mucilaginibacter sp. SP1R1]|uniref:DUF4920 domain-containing protein n=1 Tax=Mucilaginibacter sp. SP1R1 TaxID=2723091 RepID=UPI0016169742|nr:DUF4920 domain-containing protein [Mucilaginibacter sp. SP1R1]MBB6152502.1 hypothetical protein [Mucilaginibacter sp. SP1R1]
MKLFASLFFLIIPAIVLAQKHTPLPHGMVYGQKPNITALMKADTLEAFMGKKTRISTTIRGKVTKVLHQKGGWFELDAGSGKTIAAHFKNYDVTIPADLVGRWVIMEGVAQKQFIADDLQHLAGDTVTGKKQHQVKTNDKRRLTFEVKGLFVDQ